LYYNKKNTCSQMGRTKNIYKKVIKKFYIKKYKKRL